MEDVSEKRFASSLGHWTVAGDHFHEYKVSIFTSFSHVSQNDIGEYFALIDVESQLLRELAVLIPYFCATF